MNTVKYIFVAAFAVLLFSSFKSMENTDPYAKYPVYKGELCVTWSHKQTTFKVWAPKASAVKLRLYDAGNGGEAIKEIDLEKRSNGMWKAVVKKDLKNKYYTFQVMQDGKWLAEAPDIYAKAVGVNGHRGMVVDLKSTDPKGWKKDKSPKFKKATDAVIYELHIRDISVDPNSGIKNKGKFLGLTETGTIGPDGQSTGLDHIKELGITHVHIMPAFDFNSVDETKLDQKQYNWGYDPLNYNVPEGSYSTNPYDGNVRIKEFKQMVQTLHSNGLRVIMDVVYNHTTDIDHSNFSQFAPGYFYRHNPDGSYCNGTGCGNETASEQPMMRKFMMESVLYWVKEYHVDGFRFDLMGIHDIKTMNAISDTLHKIEPGILIYGEGWTAGSTVYPEDKRAVKKNAAQLHNIAVFSDDIRDGLKGGFSDVKERGFVDGNPYSKESVMFGIVASVKHPQIDYSKANSKKPWAKQPYQAITYVSCHDDNTLFDRLKIGNPNASEADLIKMDKLAHTIIFTSQGVTFIQSGAEFLRTKQGVANSFNSPDEINEIDWSRKVKYAEVYNYYKALIALRKAHPAFRMPRAGMIRDHLNFIETNDPLTIAYQLTANANGDKWQTILVLLNGNKDDKQMTIPAGNWTLVSDGSMVNEKGIKTINSSTITVPGTTAYILYH
jgi:pullulanase